MDRRLEERLAHVALRRQRLDLSQRLRARWLGTAALAATLAAICLLTGSSAGLPVLVVIVLGLMLTIRSVARCRPIASDLEAAAREVESGFPDLDHRLLAAVGYQGRLPDARLGYLEQVVLDQSLEHARGHEWTEAVPSAQLHRSQSGQWIALTLLLMSLFGLASLPHPQPGYRSSLVAWLSGRAGGQFQVVVEPGDASVERGTDLLVLARFTGPLPSTVQVAFGRSPEAMDRLQLSKSLDDPVFGGRVPSVREDLVYHVEFDDQRSRDFHVTVFEYPHVDRMNAEIRFPEYTAIPDKKVEDTRQVSAVEGSAITLDCRLNKPVARAWLTDDQDRRVDLFVGDSPTEYRVTLTPGETTRYAVHLEDAEGRSNKLPPEFVVQILPNRSPQLKVKFPGHDTSVSPLEELSLEATAWDDFGVGGFGLIYSLGGAPAQSVPLGSSIPAQETRTITHLLALEPMGVKPDQLLSYAFWAEDVGPDGQTRRTLSDMYFAEVRPFDEIFREGESPAGGESPQESQQGAAGAARQMTQLAELEKEIINATWNLMRRESGPNLSGTGSKDVAVIGQSQQTALEQTARLAEDARDESAATAVEEIRRHMGTALERLQESVEASKRAPLDFALAAEQAALEALLRLRAREHRVMRQRMSQRQAGAGGGENQFDRRLQELELDSRENRYEQQRTASSAQQAANREDSQVLNRLRELARRQQDVNQRIKELQNTIQEAKTEAEREEARRQLARLREEQQELLRDMDELRNRMDRPENQQRMAQTRQELERTREQMRQASQALDQEQTSPALNAGTRAQRELEEARDEFRRRTANQFSESMRSLRDQARELSERQREVGQKLEAMNTATQRSLRDNDRQQADQELQQQETRLDHLLEDMKHVSEESETSEPLLSRQLYDTVRDTHQRKLEQNLKLTEELLHRGFLPESSQTEKKVRQDVEQLRRGVERAARSVLGDPTEAMRRALSEVEDLSRQLQREIAQADSNNRSQPGDPSQPPTSQPDAQEPSQADDTRSAGRPQQAQQGQPRRGQGREGQPRLEPGAPARDDQTRPSPRPGRPDTESDPRQGREPQPGAQPGRPGAQPGDPRRLDAAAWAGPGGPITGDQYREWSDRLRDVEEMIDDPELRADVATIRDRARGVRQELKRHSAEPNWPLVRTMIAEPLVELEARLREQIALQEPGEKLAPIDRDPVPRQFSEHVRRYYERLGSGQ